MVTGWDARAERRFGWLYMPANYGKPNTKRRSQSPRATKPHDRPFDRMALCSGKYRNGIPGVVLEWPISTVNRPWIAPYRNGALNRRVGSRVSADCVVVS